VTRRNRAVTVATRIAISHAALQYRARPIRTQRVSGLRADWRVE